MTSPAALKSDLLRRALRPIALSVVLLCSGYAAAIGAVALDPTTKGKWTPKSLEYHLPASIDTEVVPEGGTMTELWARVWYPTGKALPTQGSPIVVMLHGNHATCGHKDSTGKWYIDNTTDYSTTGKCPSTSPRISPSHLGYDYIGSQLATQGYVVVSINSNRGINGLAGPSNDPNLIYRRARLILRHLQTLSDWNKGAGPKPVPAFVSAVKGKLDFSHVSLFGHSRGGDAIVAALYMFQLDVDTWRTKRLPPATKIGTLVAVAPTADTAGLNVPGQAPLAGIALGVLLPMCDGDVDRLNGIHFYDRSVNLVPGGAGEFRASFAVWGADHNAFNTMWQPNDAFDLKKGTPGSQTCPGQTALFPTIGNSDKQKAVGLYFAEAVIQARSNSVNYGQLLNPEFALPSDLSKITYFDRGYFPGLPADSALRLVKFDSSAGECGQKLFTYPGAVSSCEVPPEHDYDANQITATTNTWVARIRWGAPASTDAPLNGYYYAGTVLNNGAPVDLSVLKTLEFRMGPDCSLQVPTKAGYACTGPSAQDNGKTGSQNVMFILQDRTGTYSSYVPALAHTRDRLSVGLNETPQKGDAPVNPLYHAIMSSVRIPISEFLAHAPSTFDIKHVTGIYLLLSPDGGTTGPNPRGGIFLGDIWADKSDVAVMSIGSPAVQAGPPLPPHAKKIAATAKLPPASVALALSSMEQAPQADEGNTIVEIARKSVKVPPPPLGPSFSARSALARDVVEFTFQSRDQMIDDDLGFAVVIGAKAIKADFTYRGPNPNVVKLAIPAQVYDAMPNGSPVAVASGGSRWNFGALKKGAIR